MINRRAAARFEEPPPPLIVWLVPIASVMAGSLMTIVPIVATLPIMPPFGLLMLLAWRLRRPDAFRVWAPAPLGLFDDLVSGQPLGSAILFWSLAALAIAVLETRMVWRTFWQDWLIAGLAIAACLSLGRFVATPIGAHVDTALVMQMVAAIALYPLAARIVARIDPRRSTG